MDTDKSIFGHSLSNVAQRFGYKDWVLGLVGDYTSVVFVSSTVDDIVMVDKF